MNYNLNSKKALGKKIEAPERELDCDIYLKSGTLVLTCSAAAYEILKKAIYEHYNNSLDKSIVVYTKRSKLDNRDISIEPVIMRSPYLSGIDKQDQINNYIESIYSIQLVVLMSMDINWMNLYKAIWKPYAIR